MGEMSEDIIDGACCELCSVYFADADSEEQVDNNEHGMELVSHGHPVVCWNCWKNLSKRDRKAHQRALHPTL